MFLHTIRGSLFRQPMKYQIITCEIVVVGIRDDTVLGRFRGRSGGPPEWGFRGKRVFYRRPAASSNIVPKSTCHPEEVKPEPERVWRLRDLHVILHCLYCRRSWFCLNLSYPEHVTKICVSAVIFKFMNFKTLIFSILKINTALILLTVTSQERFYREDL